MYFSDPVTKWRNIALAVWLAGTAVSLFVGYEILLRPPETGQADMSAITTTDIIAAPGGHAYKFVAARNITWDAARSAAAKLSWHGHPGYLATIDSEAEHAFVVAKIFGANYSDVTYLGGRQTAPREWRWVTGPDAKSDGGKGRLFWTGDENGALQPGLFANWQAPAFQHGGRWDARNVCCVTIYSYGFPKFSTSLGNGFWEEGVAGYLVEFGE